MFSQKYNLESTAIVGNPFAEDIERNPYQDQIISNEEISPFLSSKIVIKGKKQKTYPSLIQYLWVLRLCYGDAIKQLLEKTPTESEEVFEKYRERCEKVFDKYKESYNISTLGKSLFKKKEPKEKLSGQFPVAKIEYESVKDFIVKRTDAALNVLYDVVQTNKKFYNKLLSTKDKNIIFFNKDPILGVGSNGKGLNLYGKKLQEIRKQLFENETRPSVITPFTKNLETLSQLDINTSKLSDVENWAAKKLELVSRVTGAFFDYLIKPREGFMIVKPSPVIVYPYDGPTTGLVITNDEDFNKLFTENVKDTKNIFGEKKTNIEYQGQNVSGWKINLKDLGTIRNIIQARQLINPVITNSMVLYVLSQILHCNILSTFDKVTFPAITENLENTISTIVKSELSSDFKNSTTVSPIACKDIWMYVSTLTEYMLLQIFTKDYTLAEASEEDVNKRFIQILDDIEFGVVSNKRDFVDHGFETDEENAVAQYFLYMCCTLTDWLDLDTVSKNEFQFCEKILLFKGDSKINIKIETCPFMDDYKTLLTKMFYNKGLIVFEKDLVSLCNFIYSISRNMSSKASDQFLTNRVYFYANII